MAGKITTTKFVTALCALLEKRWFLGTIAVGSAAGIVAAHAANRQIVRDSVGALCDALFIASFLALVVDPVLKQGLLKEAVKDVFGFIFGYSLPPELREFLNDIVADTKVIRRNCSLHWEIKPISSDPEKVELRLHSSFHIENFTNEMRPYLQRAVAYSDAPGDNGRVTALYCRDERARGYVYQYDEDALKSTELKPGPDGYVYGKSVDLPPRTAHSSLGYRMGVSYYSESVLSGLDQFIVYEMSSGIEVIVTVDDALKHCIFKIIPIPSSGKDEVRPSWDGASHQYRCAWHFKKIFVPNEMILLRWQPAPGEAQAADAKANGRAVMAPAAPAAKPAAQ
jgi:hypothetical protein